MSEKEAPKKDKLAQLLNLSPMILPEQDHVELVEHSPPENDFEQAAGDFDVVRDALLGALEQSQSALGTLTTLANQSQSARTYEVVAKLVDTIRETTKGVLDLHQKKKELMKNIDGPTNQTINNNLTLTSTEMLRIIKEKKINGS